MKKFVIYVLCVFVFGISGFFIYRQVLASRYEATAVPYINQVLPRISTWDPSLMPEYMAPEILEKVSSKQLATLMKGLSSIGELQHIGNAKFKNKSTGRFDEPAELAVITYTVDTQYSTGQSTVTISLLDLGESYRVYHFNFQSSALGR